MESMGMASRCYCKEVYIHVRRFPQITYPTLLLYLFFFYCSLKKKFFVLYINIHMHIR